MFVAIQCIRAASGITLTDFPPAIPMNPVAYTPTLVMTYDSTGPTTVITIEGTDQQADSVAQVQISSSLSLGAMFGINFKQLTTAAADTWSTPVSLATPFSARIGSLNAYLGRKFCFRTRLISEDGDPATWVYNYGVPTDVTP
jgi:hypothetical protein